VDEDREYILNKTSLEDMHSFGLSGKGLKERRG